MLTKSQVKAILDKMEVFQDGHFHVDGDRHTAQAVYPMRVIQQPEYATSLAATLGGAFRQLRPHAVLAGPGTGALLALELARALRARLVFATPGPDGWRVSPGQALLPDERVVLCDDVLTDETDFDGLARLVSSSGAQVTGGAVLIDRTSHTVAHPWPIESLVRPDAPLVASQECELCKSGAPFTVARATVPSH
jgi:orotate phosphoribosyltransferase